MISTKSSVVSIDEIDLQDHTFQISVARDIARLAESIQRVGVITPLLVIRKPSAYRIVSGFHRIEACRRLKMTQVPVRVLDEGTGMSHCVQIAIAENSFQRTLNLIETSRALNLLSKQIQALPDLLKTAASLGLPDNLAYIQKIQKLEHLPASLQDGLLGQRISLDTAIELGRMGDDGFAILRIFNALNISQSKQKEILTYIGEISIREGIDIQHLLNEPPVVDIIKDDEISPPLKIKRLRNCLKERRYPSLHAAERRFFEALKTVKLGERILLKPADYFEGDSMTLHIVFKDAHELEHHLSTLGQHLKSAPFTRLINR